MDARCIDLQAHRCNHPFHCFAAGLEGIYTIAPHFRGYQRLERIVQAAFRVAQHRVGQPPKRQMPLATCPDPYPCLARRTNPHRTMVFEIGVRFIACASEKRLGSAVVASGLRSSGDGAANTHLMTSGTGQGTQALLRYGDKGQAAVTRVVGERHAGKHIETHANAPFSAIPGAESLARHGDW
ncbi:hypothetical protein D3C72_1101170 [compost metagenome]